MSSDMANLCPQETGNYRHVSEHYPKSFLANLGQLRASGTFCDITMVVEGQKFLVHRTVLSVASPYFKAMFTGALSEQHKDTVELHDMEPKVFEKLLDFIYTGEITLGIEDCQDLLAAADILGLCDVIEACCLYMKLHLHPSNCIGIYLFADAHGCADLIEASEAYIHNQFPAVITEDEFLEIPRDILIHILQSEKLHIEQEYQVFKAAMDWIMHDVRERRIHVFDVTAPVRFPLISRNLLDKYIQECPDLSLKIAVQKIVKDFSRERHIALGYRLAQLKPYLFQPRSHSLKNIYVIGGYKRQRGGRWSENESLSSVEYFNTFQQAWIKSTPMRQARICQGAAVLNGLIYVIGGESDSMIFDSTECFDPSTNKWKMMASMTVPRCGLGVCVVDNCIYAIGGWVGAVIGDTVEKYDPQFGHWSTVDRVRTPRFAMGVTTHSVNYSETCLERPHVRVVALDRWSLVTELVYVAGGLNELSLEMGTFESYNPITHEWTPLASMGTQRAYVGLASLDGAIYAVGGWNSHQAALDTVERYSIEDDCWIEITPLRVGRAGASVAAVNGFLYVIGGRTGGDEFSAPMTVDSVECYDPETQSWLEVTQMPTGRCEGAVVVL